MMKRWAAVSRCLFFRPLRSAAPLAMASTATYQEFLPHAANGTKPTELLCEVTAGGGLPPALHCRGAVDDQHHGAGTPLEGDVQSKIDGQQPEETLLQKQGPGAVQFLLHVDADVDSKHSETTAVYIALQSIDKTGGASALFLASKNGIDKAASPFGAQSANGAVDTKETPMFTSQGGHTAVQHLQADGDVNQGDKDTTPWDRAVQEQHEQHTDVFRQLLDAQADGNPQDVNRAMPLFTTFQKGFNDTVKEIFENIDPKMSIGIKVDDSLEASLDVKKATCLERVEVAAESGKTTQLKADDSDSSDLGPFEADEKDVKREERNFHVPLQAASCEDTEDPFAAAMGGQSVSSPNDEVTSSTTPLGCCDEETWPPDFVTHSCSADASASVTDIYCQALPH